MPFGHPCPRRCPLASRPHAEFVPATRRLPSVPTPAPRSWRSRLSSGRHWGGSGHVDRPPQGLHIRGLDLGALTEPCFRDDSLFVNWVPQCSPSCPRSGEDLHHEQHRNGWPGSDDARSESGLNCHDVRGDAGPNAGDERDSGSPAHRQPGALVIDHRGGRHDQHPIDRDRQDLRDLGTLAKLARDIDHVTPL